MSSCDTDELTQTMRPTPQLNVRSISWSATPMMAKMGLSMSDIAGKSSRKPGKKAVKQSKARTKSKVKPRKGSKVAPKYKITSEGKTHHWTGRGRMPLVFKHFVEQGGSLDQCLI